uniref:Uncharacterized protein n=1 Tax=Steinernema glaseri TaxID=37863 RepID=A0A1I7XZB7_9BILA
MFKQSMLSGNCEQRYHKLLDYTTQYLNAYRGTAKFAYAWNTVLAHNDATPVFKADAGDVNMFKQSMFSGNCEQRYHKLLDYTTQYLNAYRGKAKFAYAWNTVLAH